ncbi:bola-like protein-domain-containing protein [Gaertneriomyces semiglobifer]|nr:bola-like protein-domain-containing protein [Gaertneriomyces semiglobifer]
MLFSRSIVLIPVLHNRSFASQRMAGPIYDSIQQKLTAKFAPKHIAVEDESHKHAGHAAMKGLNARETHFKVLVVSDLFEGKRLVQRHQMVYSTLDDEIKGGVHALSITAKTPTEYSS